MSDSVHQIRSNLWKAAAKALEEYAYYLRSDNKAEQERSRRVAVDATEAADKFEIEFAKGKIASHTTLQ